MLIFTFQHGLKNMIILIFQKNEQSVDLGLYAYIFLQH
jgi:hypothetical protein